MIVKQRSEPLELVLNRFLKARMDFSEDEQKHFWTINSIYTLNCARHYLSNTA